MPLSLQVISLIIVKRKRKTGKALSSKEMKDISMAKPTIKTNAEIPADKKLIINEGQELIFAEGVTLTNNGVIEGSENIKLAVTYHSNDENSSSFKDDNAKYESAPSYTISLVNIIQ